jgi:hypothetical protein
MKRSEFVRREAIRIIRQEGRISLPELTRRLNKMLPKTQPITTRAVGSLLSEFVGEVIEREQKHIKKGPLLEHNGHLVVCRLSTNIIYYKVKE